MNTNSRPDNRIDSIAIASAKFYVEKGKAGLIKNVGPENDSIVFLGVLTESEQSEFAARYGYYPFIGGK